MTEHHTDQNPAELEPTEARAGRPTNLRYVLGVSLAAIVVIMIVVFIQQAA